MRNAWLPAVLSMLVLSLVGCGSESPGPDPMAGGQQWDTPPAPTNMMPPPSASSGMDDTAAMAGAGLPGGDPAAAGMPGDPGAMAGAMPPGGPAGLPGAEMASGPDGGMPGMGGPGDMSGMAGMMAAMGGGGGMPGMPGDMSGMGGTMSPEMMASMGGMMPDMAGMPPEMMAGYAGGMGGQYPPGMGGMPGSPQSQEPPRELTYAEKAQKAFQEGRHREAFRFLFADFLSNDQEARANYEKIRWVPALQRPAMAVRWGIGVDYSAGSYEGDPKPIGVKQSANVQGRGRGGGMGGAAPGAGAMPDMGMMGGYPGMGGGGAGSGANQGARNALLDRYTGDLGKAILKRFESRLSKSGEFGQVLVDAANPKKPLPGAGRPGGGMAGMAGMGMGMGMDSGYGSGPDMAAYAGMMGAPPGMDMPGMGGYPGMGGAGGRNAEGSPDSPQQILPGLVMLGVDRREKLLDRAQEEELDVVVMFQVDVSENRRNGIINNTTRTVLYDVAKREPVKDTPARALNNMKVQNEREKRSDRDPVEDVADHLFDFIDQHVAMHDLPQGINPENTLRRVGLVLQSEAPVWERLNEIRFYRSRGLLQQADLEKAYQRLLGEDLGLQLAKGNEDKKREAVATLIGE